MPDITALLDRTTPTDLPPPDLAAIARRARRRRARRRALVVAVPVTAALVAARGLALGRWAEHDGTDIDAGTPADIHTGVGTWTRLDDSPVRPGLWTFAGALPDGRVVAWDGASATGGILDPATGRWQTLPEAPVPRAPDLYTDPDAVNEAQLAGGRLAVVSGTGDGSRHAAVYDVGSGTWTEAPRFGPTKTDAMAWDGDTLVVVRAAPVSGATEGVEAATWRWRPGEDRWRSGAPAPLSPRDIVGTAFDGYRLAFFGGAAGDSTLADGAIYDVAADTWTAIPPGPLGGRDHLTLAWSGGRLLAGGGLAAVADGDALPDLAAYDPATGTWQSLPPSPGFGIGSTRQVGFVEGETVLVVSDGKTSRGRPEGRWVYGAGGWDLAPYRGVVSLGGYVAATSDSGGLWIRDGDGDWIQAAEPPFTGDPGQLQVASGTHLITFVGDTAWVYDLAG